MAKIDDLQVGRYPELFRNSRMTLIKLDVSEL